VDAVPGNIYARNALTRLALGIRSIEFKCYRAGRAQWRVLLEDGEEFSVSTHNFGTESTVLRLAAEKLGKMGRAVTYPGVK
jgi:hypothetical protein